MRAALALVACGLWACTPFYRVDEAHGLRVADGEERARLQTRARELMSEGRAGAAAGAWEQAIELDPSPAPELFLGLAQARAAANERVAARAAARLGLARGQLSSSTARALRELLVRQYAADALYESALDSLPEASLESAMQVPELAHALGPLADADRLARAGSQEALGRYEQWLSEFGVPTHRLLVSWSANVFRVASGPAAQAALEGDRAAERGRPEESSQLYALAFRFQAPASFDLATRCARVGSAPAPAEALAEAARANGALSSNQLGAALGGYRRAVAIAPCWPEARYNLALLLAQVEQHAEALRHMQLFVRLSADSALAARAQARITEWERRADPTRAAQLEEENRRRELDFARRRGDAGAWRDRGMVFISAGGVLGAGALACAVTGLRTNDQVRAGGFPTGSDILLATELGRTANLLGTILAVSAGALVAVGLPIVLFNLDPTPPILSVSAGPGFAGLALSGAWP